ncbi:MAG: ATP-binding protein [Thermodesulfobacteriota bacterium]
MYPRGLKTSIAVNLLLVLTAAMLLTDLVMIGITRQELTRARVREGVSLLSAVAPILLSGRPDTGVSSFQLMGMLNDISANCIQVTDSEGGGVFVSGPDCESVALLNSGAGRVIETGKTDISFNGVTRGLVFPDSKNLVVSHPLFDEKRPIGAASIELRLDGLYDALRKSQRMFLVYFLINILALTLFGFFRLYRSLLRPINLLVNTAEEFRDDEGFSFLPDSRDGEFNRLSHSLNKMLTRINSDRARLQETVAELEQANLNLRKAQQEVVRAEKLASVGRLSAGIAHEIGNPIGIVLGYLDLLDKGELSDDQKKDFISRATGEVNRVNTIIRQLLDFARQPSDEMQIGVAVHEVVNEVAELCAVQPLMARVEIRVEAKAERDLVVGSIGQFKQVFINLLINAADAISNTPDGGPEGLVVIRTSNQTADELGGLPKKLRIEFIDNGPGIDAGELENIFDPFYTTKEPGKGTGLGLSICFTIIESMGGMIRAASEGNGTTITVDLPLIGPSNKDKDIN